MDTENTQDFNERLNQWAASQGFWFQLRYTVVGQGQSSVLVVHFLKLLMRVGLFALVVALGFGFYLWKRIDSPDFREGLVDSMRTTFAAKEVEIQGFDRDQGQAVIRRVGMTGGEESFFDTMVLTNARLNMGLTDGFMTDWRAGTIQIDECQLELRPGLNSEGAVAASLQTIFEGREGFDVQGFEVRSMNLSWGYFERAFGRISGSEVWIGRTADGWRMRFEGGRFSQNWLRDFEIQEMVVVLNRDGLVFDRAVLKAGDGTVNFREVKVSGGLRPELSGMLDLNRVPLKQLIPQNAQEMVSGTITGQFRLGGSINSVGGVEIEGDVFFDGIDHITLRNRLRLLDALDVIDPFRSYRKVVFNEGSFHLKTGGGRMEVSEIGLEADELMAMKGAFTIQRPKQGADALLEGASDGSGSQVGSGGDSMKIDLSEAAKAAAENREKGLDSEVDDNTEKFFEALEQDREMRRMMIARPLEAYQFQGEVVLTLPSDVFDRSSQLLQRYPPDAASGEIEVRVPLAGKIDEITVDFSDQLLDLGVRD